MHWSQTLYATSSSAQCDSRTKSHLMQSDGHAALEVTAENVTVKRRIAGEKEKPSPALRPNSTLQ